jgi:hypothetical protein
MQGDSGVISVQCICNYTHSRIFAVAQDTAFGGHVMGVNMFGRVRRSWYLRRADFQTPLSLAPPPSSAGLPKAAASSTSIGTRGWGGMWCDSLLSTRRAERGRRCYALHWLAVSPSTRRAERGRCCHALHWLAVRLPPPPNMPIVAITHTAVSFPR